MKILFKNLVLSFSGAYLSRQCRQHLRLLENFRFSPEILDSNKDSKNNSHAKFQHSTSTPTTEFADCDSDTRSVNSTDSGFTSDSKTLLLCLLCLWIFKSDSCLFTSRKSCTLPLEYSVWETLPTKSLFELPENCYLSRSLLRKTESILCSLFLRMFYSDSFSLCSQKQCTLKLKYSFLGKKCDQNWKRSFKTSLIWILLMVSSANPSSSVPSQINEILNSPICLAASIFFFLPQKRVQLLEFVSYVPLPFVSEKTRTNLILRKVPPDPANQSKGDSGSIMVWCICLDDDFQGKLEFCTPGWAAQRIRVGFPVARLTTVFWWISILLIYFFRCTHTLTQT